MDISDKEYSVFQTVTKMCRHLARTCSHDSVYVEHVTKRIRSLAFETFLFKCSSLSSSTEKHSGSLEEEPDLILADILFGVCQDGKKNPMCVTKTKNLLNVIKKMSDLIQMYPELIRMLKFLFLMANSDKIDENELEPLYGLDLRKYEFLDGSCWKKSYSSQLFQLNNELLEKKDSRFKAITSFPFTEELGSGLEYKEYFVVPSNKEAIRNWTYKNLKDYGFDDSEWMPSTESKNSVVKAANSDDGYVTPDRDISEDAIPLKPGGQWSRICNVKTSEFHTWEDLGGIYTQPELPFITESKESTIHLFNLIVNKRLVVSPQLSCISIDRFKQDVVRLLFGLESQTFFYNEERKTFVLQPGVYLDGISPDTLQDLCNDFITCANNYFALSSFLRRDSDGLNLTRRSLVFEALCNCLLHYICCYRGVVLHMSRKLTLIEGCNWIQTLKNQLEFLSDFCCVNSSQEFPGLPHGGALLAYVYSHMCQVTKKDITCLLYYILESCCNVYFRFLEKWIFEGICEDYYGEFFVEPKGMHELSQDRQYWSRGFVINKRLVPLFLSGLENDIFICGKYMRLLKLCKPNDPLFSCLQSGYPSILCYLDQQGLNRLVDECESFKKRCIGMSGTSPDIISIAFSEEQRESYFISLKQQRDRTLDRIKKDQEAKRKLQAENKRIMFEALKKDMEEARAYKIQEERNRIEEEKKMLMEAKRLDKLNELRIQEEREKLIQFYSKLSANVDLRKREAELELKKLKDLETKLLDEGYNNVNIKQELDNSELETAKESMCTEHEVSLPQNNDPCINITTRNTVSEETKCSQKQKSDHSQEKQINLKVENLPEECLNITCHAENNPEIINSSKMDELEINQTKINSKDSFNTEHEINLAENAEKHQTNVIITTGLNRKISQIEHVSAEISETEMKRKKGMLLSDTSSEKSCVSSNAESDIKDSTTGKSSKDMCSESVLCNVTDNKIAEERTKLHRKIETEGMQDATDINEIPWYNGGCMFKNNQFYFDKNPIIINITERVLKVETRKVKSDIKQIPMATINQSINKSVMIPLKIQLSLANDAILRLFVNEHKLITHLDCLRKYFFLLDGEYSHYLKHSLFSGIQKVSKPSLFLTHFNLNSLLRCAVRNTSVEDFSERLSFLVKDVPTAFHLTDPKVLDCLSLRYRIQWPVNIIITPEAILKYDQVFNFVMQLHRASWVLEQEIYILKIKLKKPSIQYRQVHLYRHVMTQFVRTWLNYITATALEDCWIELKHNLQKADNIDRIYTMHVHYIKCVTFRCLLNKQSKVINRHLLELLHTVFKFSEVLRNGEWVEVAEELQHTAFSHLFHEYGNFLRLSRYLYKYIQRLVSIGYQSHLDRLLVLLSGNDFYKVNS